MNYSTNIPKLYLIKLSKWLMLIMPIVALFYNHNGLNNSDIYFLQAVYSLSIALVEIPSGYLADIIGRKKSLIIGSFLGTVGFIIYSFSSSLGGFICAEIILGLGGSCISGSDSAMLYDSLAANNKQHEYLRFEGRITSLGNFAETIAAIGGGLIASYISYRGVYVAQTCIAAMAIPASLMLMEPPRKKITSRPGISQILSISHQALIKKKSLASAIWFSSITGTATLCMAWTCQIYFIHHGFTEKLITPLWVLLNLGAALVAAKSETVKRILGKRLAMSLIAFYIPFTYILLGSISILPALCALFIFYLVRGYATPLLRDLINKNCDSATRATVLSIRSMIIRTTFSLLGPAIGFLSSNYSLNIALVLTGIFLLITSSISAYLMIHHDGYKN